MKKIGILTASILTSLIALSDWYGSATTFTTGTYTNPNWGAAITIAANNNVTFNNAQFSSGSVTIRSGATLTINNSGNFQGNGPITLEAGATLNVNANFDINSSTVINNNGGTINVTGNVNHSQAQLTVNQGGVMNVSGTLTSGSGNLNIQRNGTLRTANLVLNGNSTFGGIVAVSNTTTINGGSNTFAECSQLSTNTLSISNGNVVNGTGFLRIFNAYNNGGNGGWTGHQLTSNNSILVYYGGPATTNSFGNATRTNSTTNPCYILLPAIFTQFVASEGIDGKIDLIWSAAENANTDYYEVEVSTDGEHFETVQKMNTYQSDKVSSYQLKLNY